MLYPDDFYQAGFARYGGISEIQFGSFKILQISYQNQLRSDEGPKIAPIYFSRATLNFTTT